MHDPVFPNGCAVCEVEVDPETGWVDLVRYSVVDDVGRCINPLIVHGQTHGGAAQGIGQAMWEECVVDPASGQPLVGLVHGLRDAARRQYLPSFETRDRRGAVADQPARHQGRRRRRHAPRRSAVVISAILDALRPLGVTELTMPATPFRVWQAIQRGKGRLG